MELHKERKKKESSHMFHGWLEDFIRFFALFLAFVRKVVIFFHSNLMNFYYVRISTKWKGKGKTSGP
jgi:hypothetical protein